MLGTLGLFSYLQAHNIAAEDKVAEYVSTAIHKEIQKQAIGMSVKLGKLYGVPEWCQTEERRNSHLLSLAPTRTNAIITGAYSQGIEPPESNYYVAKQNKRSFVRKNPNIVKLIDERVKSEEEKEKIWDSILAHQGSIKHLTDLFTEHEIKVFKTAREIDQKDLIRLAASRQPYICQGQSLNLFVDKNVNAKELWTYHLLAWKLGVKSLYYLKGKSLIVDRKSIDDPPYTIITSDTCPFCHKLKDQLVLEGKEFKEVSLADAKAQGVWDKSWKTIPQLFHFGERIGGYDDYMGKVSEGECLNCEG